LQNLIFGTHRYEPLVCDTDDAAITKAKDLLDGHDIELWSGARLVAKLKPEK
jgi:hypothetical protein